MSATSNEWRDAVQKRISVKVAGQERLETIEIGENTTAAEALTLAKCPVDFELLPPGGMPLGKSEPVYGHVQEGGKLCATPPAVAGGDSTEGTELQ